MGGLSPGLLPRKQQQILWGRLLTSGGLAIRQPRLDVPLNLGRDTTRLRLTVTWGSPHERLGPLLGVGRRIANPPQIDNPPHKS